MGSASFPARLALGDMLVLGGRYVGGDGRNRCPEKRLDISVGVDEDMYNSLKGVMKSRRIRDMGIIIRNGIRMVLRREN
jgi:hypothetical protein